MPHNPLQKSQNRSVNSQTMLQIGIISGIIVTTTMAWPDEGKWKWEEIDKTPTELLSNGFEIITVEQVASETFYWFRQSTRRLMHVALHAVASVPALLSGLADQHLVGNRSDAGADAEESIEGCVPCAAPD